MQKILQWKNFILYFLLCVLITAGLSAAPSYGAAAAARMQDGSAVFCTPGLSQPDECLPERISSKSSGSVITGILRNSRIVSSYRLMLLFSACVLTLMLFLANMMQQLILIQDSRHLYQDDFIITFIQNTDGRKRISYSFS